MLEGLSFRLSRPSYKARTLAPTVPLHAGSVSPAMSSRDLLQSSTGSSLIVTAAPASPLLSSALHCPAIGTLNPSEHSADPNLKAPAQPERRERLLQEMVRKARKPVVLFIDEAHDIHGHTLNGLKRLMELITAGGGKLSVVLVGHPRLQNDLRRATMEEIGNRTSKFDFVALGSQRREFLQWLLETCLEDGVAPDSVITPQAQDFLVERLSTPLQFAEHLNRAFTDAFNLGAEKVSREIVENTNTLSAGFDSLDARLARIGYTPKALAERFDAHPTEVRRFLNGRLDPERTARRTRHRLAQRRHSHLKNIIRT